MKGTLCSPHLSYGMIRESTSIDTFKRKLKTHLFEKASVAKAIS